MTCISTTFPCSLKKSNNTIVTGKPRNLWSAPRDVDEGDNATDDNNDDGSNNLNVHIRKKLFK